MSSFSISHTLFNFAHSAFKASQSKLREFGVLKENVNWSQRAEICERCPMRTIRKKISYCGAPYAEMPVRDESADGCGCPIVAKAKDPAEHCPQTPRHLPVTIHGKQCDCKWCTARQNS